MLRRQLTLESLESRYLLAADITSLISDQHAAALEINDPVNPTKVAVDVESFAFFDYPLSSPFPSARDIWAYVQIEGSIQGQAGPGEPELRPAGGGAGRRTGTGAGHGQGKTA